MAEILRMPHRRGIADNDARGQLFQDIICAYHIMDLLGQPSGMGSHLTGRLPGADTFLFNVHNFGFGEVTPELVHEADFDLNV
ncbi:MAG: hypothetical protein VX741_01285 [Pseudomonadota bacterium]|nr:hypothetical protein [Pseudomonadota bacterium]